MTYQFSDTELAARRLSYLAGVFEPTTRSFLAESAAHLQGICLDLGCGLGHTTHLLAEITNSERVVGLDSSASFLSAAAATATPRTGFSPHDVLEVPFPTAPVDTVFCRFLLSHLSNPLSVVDRWVTQLRPAGRLLLEEVERIQIADPLFRDYLGVVTALLASESQQLYVGRLLATARPSSAEVIRNGVAELSVPGSKAATMFHMNIQSWKDREFVRQTYSADFVSDLQESLRAVAREEVAAGPVVWGMRQITISVRAGSVASALSPGSPASCA